MFFVFWLFRVWARRGSISIICKLVVKVELRVLRGFVELEFAFYKMFVFVVYGIG